MKWWLVLTSVQNQLNNGVEKLVGYAYNVGNNLSIQEIEVRI